MMQVSSYTKDTIVTFIENQIDSIIGYYEKQIRELKSENLKLENEVLDLRTELEERNRLLEASLFHNQEKADKEPKLVLTEKLDRLKTLSDQVSFGECMDILLDLKEFHPDLFSKEDQKQLMEFFLKLFKHNPLDVYELDGVYMAAFALLHSSIHLKDFIHFIQENSDLMSGKVMDLNEPSIIDELARLYFTMDLNQSLNNLLHALLDQWAFFDANIEKREYIRILWYSFFLSKDSRLLEESKMAAAYLQENEPEIVLYQTYYDVINGNVPFEMGSLKIDENMKKLVLFEGYEKDKLFKSLEMRLRKYQLKNEGKKGNTQLAKNESTNRKIWYLTKLPTQSRILPDMQKILQEEWIHLAIFKDRYLREDPRYVLVKVLSNKKEGKAYVTDAYIQEVRRKIGRHWIDIREYQGEDKIEKKIDKSEIEQNLFAWPSTDLSKTAGNESEEKGQFNETSELRKLGYQITGLTRAKRWSILETAVKKLGLKKVAYTIAQNVKLRKGQKDGLKKFSYAIAEWEHDLMLLKQKYYLHNFTWPTTNVNN
jgi:hypothetical protein